MCFGAFEKKDLIGFLLLETRNHTIFMINHFRVLPLFRDLGIGSKLLKQAEDYCINYKKSLLILRANTYDHDIVKLNDFLHINGWNTTSYDFTKYRIYKNTFEDIFINKFFERNLLLEDPYHEFFFNELSKKEIFEVNKKTNLNGNIDLISLVFVQK
ncbi:MAG TPA: GNAT family N-acetyltransferase [Ignavibacteria bacterium]|nr:GNAT family N-acetyltransferase [Ignavibacteria bacterium]